MPTSARVFMKPNRQRICRGGHWPPAYKAGIFRKNHWDVRHQIDDMAVPYSTNGTNTTPAMMSFLKFVQPIRIWWYAAAARGPGACPGAFFSPIFFRAKKMGCCVKPKLFCPPPRRISGNLAGRATRPLQCQRHIPD